MSSEYRDITLDELSERNLGNIVKIAGWVENIRDHGGIKFADIRDFYGVLQIVFRNEKFDFNITKEECVSVIGKIVKRKDEDYNYKISTGKIELEVERIEILGKVIEKLPFEPIKSKEVKEDIRLKYRYLDLRNRKVKNNILLRSRVIQFLRQKMIDMGFVEIQTPILCASSPEGARDFIVPSRNFEGKFYALPQAPQQYKQLLMAAGFDRYFQIAPCFRDEDARADRSPGEFYQLDFEMCFATEEDIFEVGEKVLVSTFKKFAPDGYKITESPFPVFSYEEAMLKYGTDKPDLRNPLIIIDLTEFFQKCSFKPFYEKTVRAIKVSNRMSKGFHEKLLKYALSLGMEGLGYLELLENGRFKGPIDKFIPMSLKDEFLKITSMEPGNTIFFIADEKEKVASYAGEIRKELGKRLDLIENKAYRFCYINDFPMFEFDDSEKRFVFTHNPFSMPKGGLEALESSDYSKILAYQYDIVCNGVELSSGAVRNHDLDIMTKVFEIAGYSENELKNKFGALYTAFKFGPPPHAGMAPGIDRMIMLLAEEENIREVITFPMNGNAQDLMCGAPGIVSESQLSDVHIEIRNNDNKVFIDNDNNKNLNSNTAINNDTIKYVSELSYLELSDKEKEAAKNDMNRMVEYINMINEVDTANIEPISHAFPLKNIYRKDVVVNSDGKKETLKNVSEIENDMICVPRTFD